METVVRNKLESAGLAAALNEEKSQFLDVADGFFAEVVLDDASRLAAAEQIVRSVQEELNAKGVEIDVIVRAVWKLKTINFIGSARSVSGGLKAALEFEAVLESGSRTCSVTVEVTLAALNNLREKLALSDKVGFPGWAKDGDVDEETLRKVVAEFLAFQLSVGGSSSWDPIRFPKMELKEAAVSYLMPDSKSFKQLRVAIDDFLGDYAIEYSLRELATRDARIRDFERILPDLSSHLGGAFRPGQELPMNALSLYQGLGTVERERLKQHYLQKVGQIAENLRQKYPRIFLD